MISTHQFLRALVTGDVTNEQLCILLSNPKVSHIVQRPINILLLDDLNLNDEEMEACIKNVQRVNDMIVKGDVDQLQYKKQTVEDLFKYQSFNRDDVGNHNFKFKII